MRELIQGLIVESLANKEISDVSPEILVPENPDHGDFSTNIAMQLTKILQKNPREIAQNIIEDFPQNQIIEKIEIAGPGFINFFLKNAFIQDKISCFQPELLLENNNPQKICLDFSSPNIAKPLHIGNFRTTIIGDALQRILRFSGEKVVSENYIGDWGTGFGKLVVAIEKWGDKEQLEKGGIEDLVELYQKFNIEAEKDENLEDEAREKFRKLEQDGDKEIEKIWKWIVEISLRDVQKFYDQLDISFDRIQGEGYYQQFSGEALKKLEKIITDENGAWVKHFFDKEKKDDDGNPVKRIPSLLFKRSDGATLYQTRDIAKLLQLEKEGVDTALYVVGNEQSLHFQQIFEVAKELGIVVKGEHIPFGLVLDKQGKKFSTRKGNSVGLQPLLDEAKERVMKIVSDRVSDLSAKEKEKLVEQVAFGAIKFNDLSQNRTTDIVFDWDKMLSFEGFSGPFLQYSYARARSILRKAETSNTFDKVAIDDLILKTENFEKEEILLMKKIIAFSDTVKLSARTRKPNLLAEYLFELSKTFNRFYQNISILNAKNADQKISRLFLVDLFSRTLKQGLSLLGIESPEVM